MKIETHELTFTCDQCGIIHKVSFEQKTPMDWGTLKHSDRYEETIEEYHFCSGECYDRWLEQNKNKHVNNDSWSLYIKQEDNVSSVWPRNPVEDE